MQRSYRWQPHLPFFPVDLPYDPWAQRYNFTFQTLPIIQHDSLWYLAPNIGNQWYRHAEFFSKLIRAWRMNIARAPMSVNYLQELDPQEVSRGFQTEEKARRFFWYYRTQIFSLFAEFSFICSNRPGWKDDIIAFCEKNNTGSMDDRWLEALQDALCDFRYTKRAGVIIDVEKTELWAILRRYHENGVPVLMDVGFVDFYDKHEPPKDPVFYISPVTNYVDHKLTKDWPRRAELVESTKQYLRACCSHRLGPFLPPPPPLSVPRPFVEELGADVHARGSTTPWINPLTNEPSSVLQLAAPTRADLRYHHIGWIEWFELRRKVQEKMEQNETPVQKQKRESRLRDSLRINKVISMGPSKKSKVFVWTEEPSEEGVSARDDIGPVWKRVKADRDDVEWLWDRHLPSQRKYDPYFDEWDLHIQFDRDAQHPNHDNEEDEDDEMGDDATHIDKINMRFQDELEGSQFQDPYDGVQLLASQITFLSPKSLANWALLALRLRSPQSLVNVSYPATSSLIGYVVNDTEKLSTTYRYIQEFVKYIVDRDFDNPRLSDLRIPLPTPLPNVELVQISLYNSGSPFQWGYILTTQDDDKHANPWILVVNEATSVLQIVGNHWQTTSMVNLVRELVRHGIQFRTLTPATEVIPESILELNKAPDEFTSFPPLDLTRSLNSADYARYVELRERITLSPHGRAAFRMGGILWRLAMETQENFDDVINEIMDGPSEQGPGRGEYVFVNKDRYYDLVVNEKVAQIMCGVHGTHTGQFQATGCTFKVLFNSFTNYIQRFLLPDCRIVAKTTMEVSRLGPRQPYLDSPR